MTLKTYSAHRSSNSKQKRKRKKEVFLYNVSTFSNNFRLRFGGPHNLWSPARWHHAGTFASYPWSDGILSRCLWSCETHRTYYTKTMASYAQDFVHKTKIELKEYNNLKTHGMFLVVSRKTAAGTVFSNRKTVLLQLWSLKQSHTAVKLETVSCTLVETWNSLFHAEVSFKQRLPWWLKQSLPRRS